MIARVPHAHESLGDQQSFSLVSSSEREVHFAHLPNELQKSRAVSYDGERRPGSRKILFYVALFADDRHARGHRLTVDSYFNLRSATLSEGGGGGRGQPPGAREGEEGAPELYCFRFWS